MLGRRVFLAVLGVCWRRLRSLRSVFAGRCVCLSQLRALGPLRHAPPHTHTHRPLFPRSCPLCPCFLLRFFVRRAASSRSPVPLSCGAWEPTTLHYCSLSALCTCRPGPLASPSFKMPHCILLFQHTKNVNSRGWIEFEHENQAFESKLRGPNLRVAPVTSNALFSPSDHPFCRWWLLHYQKSRRCTSCT